MWFSFSIVLLAPLYSGQEEIFKGTVNVIFIDSPFKDGNARFKTVPFTALSEKLEEKNTFRKTPISSTFFIRLRFQGYRCKSGIAIFALRIT